MNVVINLAPRSCFTRQELLATFDDDLGFVREIVDAFISRCPILIGEMREGALAGDAGAVSRAAHTLKGSIGYFEEGDAYSTAETIEHISAEDLPRVPALLASLEQSVGDITRYLNAEFSS